MKSLKIGFVNKIYPILQEGEGLRKEWKVLSKRSNYSFNYFNNTELYSRMLKPCSNLGVKDITVVSRIKWTSKINLNKI